MMWAQILAFSVGSLIFVNPAWGNARGNFTDKAYARHFLPLFRHFWMRTSLQYQQYMGYPEWLHFPEHQTITMQDNSSIHRSRVATNAIRQLNIQVPK